MARKRHFRALLVRLECDCQVKLNTSRYRVSKDLAACLMGDAVRKGVWCYRHGGKCHPVEFLGVVRDD